MYTALTLWFSCQSVHDWIASDSSQGCPWHIPVHVYREGGDKQMALRKIKAKNLQKTKKEDAVLF